MPSNRKNFFLAIVSVLVIAASGVWIYYREFKAPRHNVALHRWVGEVMATHHEAELATQLDAFRRALQKLGPIEIKEDELDPKDQPKYGVGSGLSGRRFVRLANKNKTADAIVSFVGAPKLADEDIAQLTRVPKFLAECRSADHLPKLFEKNLVAVAVVNRFQYPAPGPPNPRTPQEWFDKRYQIVRAKDVADLPKPE